MGRVTFSWLASINLGTVNTTDDALMAKVGEGDLAQAVRTAVINKRAGGTGLISGRKAFQRPMPDGIALLHAIQDVYLDDEVTIA